MFSAPSGCSVIRSFLDGISYRPTDLHLISGLKIVILFKKLMIPVLWLFKFWDTIWSEWTYHNIFFDIFYLIFSICDKNGFWKNLNFKHGHCWYIEPRNREKSLTLIWQRFSCLLDEWIAKISKKNFFHGGFLR